MARTVRDARLETREARLKLKVRDWPYWRGIHEGLSLGYQRGERGGAWRVRLWDGQGYRKASIGLADDHADADGHHVFSFRQAQAAAIALERDLHDGGRPKSQTVAEAGELYLTWYRGHRKAIRETEHAFRAHIVPALGDKLLGDLKARDIRAWHEKLALRPARLRTARLAKKPNLKPAPSTDDEKRARRATANRVLTVLKAILNRAFNEGSVADDREWRRVRPFPKADEARIRFISSAEATRLVNACPSDLRKLVQAALLTGARYGELASLRVSDVNVKGAQIYIAQSKSGKPRHVPLNPEGVKLLDEATTGKTGDQLVFIRRTGAQWGKNHHVRPLLAACTTAKIKPAVAFHELRHTYASQLAQVGVDLLTISKLLGHADTRITSKHYAHLADKTLANAVLKLPSLAGEKRANMKPVQGGKRAT